MLFVSMTKTINKKFYLQTFVNFAPINYLINDE